MRLSTGEIVYTNPYAADSDNDGLLDGEEICVAVDGLRLLQYPGLPLEYGKQVVFLKIADPWDRDTDDDGIWDGEDTAPVTKGLADGIYGEIAVVASEGHAFMIYKSYINDSIPLFAFDEVFSYHNSIIPLYYTDEKLYRIKRDHYMTISLAANDTSVNVLINSVLDLLISGMLGHSPVTNGGAKCNWELYNYQGNNSDNQQPNYSIKKIITSDQLYKLIQYWNSNSYYSLWTHNCSIFAANAWNLISDIELPVTPYPFLLKASLDYMKSLGIGNIYVTNLDEIYEHSF